MRAAQERELVEYVDRAGSNLFREWLDSLKDMRARARIDARLLRLRLGNFGDAKSVGAAFMNSGWITGPAIASTSGSQGCESS
jgi:putative addiction module killer protein